MAALVIRAEELVPGDRLVLPFQRSATIDRVKPVGPRTSFVQFHTEFGWARVEVDTEVAVEPR